jgi:hypothetical protein
MSNVVRLPFTRDPWPPRRTLREATWRNRLASALWIAIGIPLSLGIFALQLFGTFGWRCLGE